ncbi:MAG: hypothetical protein AB9866_18690 [Syntrophobacteraceae bacterium]
MFVRSKRSGPYEYLQIVENRRVEGRVTQRVIATIGRLDRLKERGGSRVWSALLPSTPSRHFWFCREKAKRSLMLRRSALL